MRIVIALLCFTLWGGRGDTRAQESAMASDFNSEVSGSFRGDYRFFPDDPLYPGQEREYFSTLFQPEIYMEWKDGRRLLKFIGFARLDQYDTRRSHADIRELYGQAIFSGWEVSLGFKKIFWGVAESNHLVDIVNQADALEGFDLEQKLGQPMCHVSFTPRWGTVDVYGMTWFRPMQFPGPRGRLRPPFELDNDLAAYESELEEWHPDVAVRWSHSLGIMDVGLSHFYGTSRLPLFTTPDGFSYNPYYELIHQSGLDVQVSTGAMLWKGEAIYRQNERKKITAFVAGGEYTISNVAQSGIDIGLLAEYSYDDRGLESINGLDDDVFFGSRIAVNDRQSTDFLGGVIVDRNNGTIRYFAEANRRVGSAWKVSVEASGFEDIDTGEFLYLIRNDSFIQFSLARYF